MSDSCPYPRSFLELWGLTEEDWAGTEHDEEELYQWGEIYERWCVKEEKAKAEEAAAESVHDRSMIGRSGRERTGGIRARPRTR